ncbi:hypothetical protein [Streptomyces sp. NPDC052225]|uniref:hypothetical protein n=1 Tax=Streptomyces sp. NPDC052225 TaxID=3154949 RepID=UPI00344A7276
MPAPPQTRHPSSGDLALIALGCDAVEAAERHLERCVTCRSTLAEFRRAFEAGRAGPTPSVPPPAGLWEQIRKRL